MRRPAAVLRRDAQTFDDGRASTRRPSPPEGEYRQNYSDRKRETSGDSASLALPSGPSRRAVDRAGHPRAIFQRAIEHGNLVVAEDKARELGRLTVAEALDLVVLVVEKEPGRRSSYTVRWLRRLLEERAQTTIEEAALAASALAALASPAHAQAMRRLRPWPNGHLGSDLPRG
jgi:hypothetical protein